MDDAEDPDEGSHFHDPAVDLPSAVSAKEEEQVDTPKDSQWAVPQQSPLWDIGPADEEDDDENEEDTQPEEDDDIDTVELLDIVPGEEGDEQEPSPITFALQPGAALHLAKESALLLVVTALLSSASFGFISLYFLLILSWPSAWSELPAGYASWTSCLPNATRPAATALGQALPYNMVRALISVPYILEFAFLVTVIGGAISRWHLRAATISGLVTFCMALLAVTTYIGADGLDIHAMPVVADQVVTGAMVVLVGMTQTFLFVRRRRSYTGIVARCPKLFFLAAFFGLFVTQTLLSTLLVAMENRGASPSIVVCTLIAVSRLVGFLARHVFLGLNLPVIGCFSVLFIYQTASALVARRYWLALPGLEDVGLAAGISAVLNVAFNVTAATYAFFSYNSLVGKGRFELAGVQFNIFFTGIIGDLIAEHVGLHSGLAYSLYLDPRILRIHAQSVGDRAVEAWALSFAVELAVDVLLLVPLLCFLPARAGMLFRKHLRSMTVVTILICSCVHAHLAGLNLHLQADRFFCY